MRPVPGVAMLTQDHPLAHDCPECQASAGFFCTPTPPRDEEGRRCATHFARHGADDAVVYGPETCYLCEADISAYADLPYGERLGNVGAFHVSGPDGRDHLGYLCYSCYFPAGFWRAVEAKIRERDVGEPLQHFRCP